MLESTPFRDALVRGTLPRVAAISFLHGLAIVVATLERSLSERPGRSGRRTSQQLKPELPVLLADLRTLESERVPAIRPAVKEAIRLADDIVMLPRTQVELLGCQQTICELQAEASELRDHFAASLETDPANLTYLAPRGSGPGSRATRIRALIDAVAAGPERTAQVVHGAELTRNGLIGMVAALYPFDPGRLRYQVTAVNPEAGDHPMPSDPVEIDIAIRAGARARERFPYIDARFGERGRRYTTSDSCWLVTLTKHDYLVVSKSIGWLRRVLAVRGLPSILVEAHMEEIVAEFERVLPAKASSMHAFRRVLAELVEERESLLPQAAVAALTERFEAQFAAIDGRFSPIVPVLASSCADERAGIRGAFSSVRTWLDGAGPRDSEWPGIVHDLAAELESVLPAATS